MIARNGTGIAYTEMAGCICTVLVDFRRSGWEDIDGGAAEWVWLETGVAFLTRNVGNGPLIMFRCHVCPSMLRWILPYAGSSV